MTEGRAARTAAPSVSEPQASASRPSLESKPAHILFLLGAFILGGLHAVAVEGMPTTPEGYGFVVGAGVGRLGISLVLALVMLGWHEKFRGHVPALAFGLALFIELARLISATG